MKPIYNPFLLSLFLSAIAMSWHCPASIAKEFDLGLQSSKRLSQIAGEYHGEIRLQSSDGAIDQLINSKVMLKVALLKDSIRVTNSPEFLGKKCNSEIGGILELKEFSPDQAQLLSAEFDFHEGKCFANDKIDNLVIFITRDEQGALVLETVQNKYSKNNHSNNKSEMFIHGYFMKVGPANHRPGPMS